MRSRQSLRYKIYLSVTLTMLAVAVVFGMALTVFETQRRQSAIEQIELSLNDLTLQYREQLGNEIFASQSIAVQATLAEVMKRKNVLAISAYDESGAALAAVNIAVPDDLPPELVARLASRPDSVLRQWEGRSVLTYTSPIVAFGEQVGFWQINYALAALERQTLEIIAIFIALIFSAALLIGLFLNSILVRFVLKPVYRLRNAMQHIQGSDHEVDPLTGRTIQHQTLDKMILAIDNFPDDAALSPGAHDEIASLANSFRQMLFALKTAYTGIRTDRLTGLHNRLKLDEVLEGEANRAKRYGSRFSIIMLDIDNFKGVNDCYGHLAGDAVLHRVAELLEENLRGTDTVGRWGGEEFLILLPRQDKITAGRVAEKLRATLADCPFTDVGAITASFGVTESIAEDTAETLVKRADEALYEAKRSGRNRVEMR